MKKVNCWLTIIGIFDNAIVRQRSVKIGHKRRNVLCGRKPAMYVVSGVQKTPGCYGDISHFVSIEWKIKFEFDGGSTPMALTEQGIDVAVWIVVKVNPKLATLHRIGGKSAIVVLMIICYLLCDVIQIQGFVGDLIRIFIIDESTFEILITSSTHADSFLSVIL